MCNSGLLTVQKAMLEANWKMFYIFKKKNRILSASTLWCFRNTAFCTDRMIFLKLKLLLLMSVFFCSRQAFKIFNSETSVCVSVCVCKTCKLSSCIFFKRNPLISYFGFSSGSGSFRPSPTGLFSASSAVTR